MVKRYKYCRICGYDQEVVDGFCIECGENLVNPIIQRKEFDTFDEEEEMEIKEELDEEDLIK